MATCQTVIKRALRMLGVLAAGREPDAADAADSLEALQGLYNHLIVSGTFGRLRDVLVSANYTAGENERVINTSGSPITITLPTTITDTTGCTPWPDDFGRTSTSTRAVRDRSIVVEAGAAPAVHIYDAHLASWVNVEALALTDPAPLSARLETGLACLLALHINPEFKDGDAGRTVAMGAAQAMSALTQRWDSPRFATQAEYL